MTIEQLGEESIKHGEQLKTLFGKVDSLTEKMNAIESLTLSVQKLAMSVEQIANNQAEDRAEQKKIIAELGQLRDAPIKEKADTYDSVAKYVLMAVVGAVVGYLIKKFGL